MLFRILFSNTHIRVSNVHKDFPKALSLNQDSISEKKEKRKENDFPQKPSTILKTKIAGLITTVLFHSIPFINDTPITQNPLKTKPFFPTHSNF